MYAWHPRHGVRVRVEASFIRFGAVVLHSALRGTLAYQVGADWVEVGSPLVYGATHQFGRGPIPARPYLGLSADDEVDIHDEILDFIEDALRWEPPSRLIPLNPTESRQSLP